MNLKSLEPLQRRIGHFPIELPASVLMALAVALVTFALPSWRFEGLVAATGLPGVIGAAQPPLGQTARVVVALVLSTLSFAAVWYGLRALDRGPVETDFPSFRAADLHPDAPRRRPILAGAEFGVPADDLPPIEEQIRRRKFVPAEPLPSFLAPQPSEIGDFVPNPEPVSYSPPEPSEDERHVDRTEEPPSPSLLRTHAPLSDPEPEPVAPLKPVAVDDFMQDPDAPEAAFDPIEDIYPPRSRQVEIMPIEPSFEVPAAAPTAPDEGDGPPTAEATSQDEESVSELMARLESGLSKRESKPEPSGSSYFAQEELRRAMNDLDRVAGRDDRS